MTITYVKVLGLILLIIGILGLIPALAPDHMLFGIFMMNTAHNIFHIISGLVLLAIGMSDDTENCRRITLLFAAIYGLITIFGFLMPGKPVLGMPMNMADNVLHLAITASAVIFGLPKPYIASR